MYMVIDDSDTDGTDIEYLDDGRWNALTRKRETKLSMRKEVINQIRGKEMRKQHKE